MVITCYSGARDLFVQDNSGSKGADEDDPNALEMTRQVTIDDLKRKIGQDLGQETDDARDGLMRANVFCLK